jgi:hypothetical protein
MEPRDPRAMIGATLERAVLEHENEANNVILDG